MSAHVNFLAVLAATVAGMAVGFIWFSPGLFGNAWLKIIGMDPNDKARMDAMRKGMGPLYLLMLAGVFISAYMLARFIGWLNAGTLLGGIKIAFYAWLGFMLQVILGFSIFSGRDKSSMWNTILIQGGHYLTGLLIMGAILGAWR